MNFTEIDFNSFAELLKSMKKEIEADIKENPELDDESRILLDSINLLIKELKGVNTYDDLSLEKKKVVLPHLSLVFIFTRSLYEDEEFEDEEMMDWDLDEEEEEGEEGEEGEKAEKGVKGAKEGSKPLPVKSQGGGCCGGGQDHEHPTSQKSPKGKK